jgi:hypothetical protein
VKKLDHSCPRKSKIRQNQNNSQLEHTGKGWLKPRCGFEYIVVFFILALISTKETFHLFYTSLIVTANFYLLKTIGSACASFQKEKNLFYISLIVTANFYLLKTIGSARASFQKEKKKRKDKAGYNKSKFT